MAFVAGIGVSGGQDPDLSLEELVFGAVAAALDDAGLTRADIDGVCLAADDQLDGRAISSMHLAGPAGARLRDEVKVADDGSLAFATAVMRVESGAGRRVLAVSWFKPDGSDIDAANGVNPEPVYTRPTAQHPWTAEAMVTSMFLARAGLTPDIADHIAEAGGRSGGSDDWLAYPLRRRHIPPATEGAVAVVVTAEATGICVEGLRWGVDPASPEAQRDGGSLAAIAGRAYGEAGYTPEPSTAVETTDRSLFRLCMTAAGLGLTPTDEAGAAVVTGALPGLNPTGGLWTRNPVFAAGLECVARAGQRIRGGESTVVAHSCYGHGGQGNFVTVLGAR